MFATAVHALMFRQTFQQHSSQRAEALEILMSNPIRNGTRYRYTPIYI